MITFHNQGSAFQPRKKSLLRKWINTVAAQEQCSAGNINYIFCNDEELLKINIQYLHHKTLTDIITFDYSENKTIAGDIFISIERVTENAQKYSTGFDDELHRVLIHGVLHLCGYKDKTGPQEKIMRKKENAALNLLNSL